MRMLLLTALLLAQVALTDGPQPAPLSALEQANMRSVGHEVQRVNALYELAQAAKDKADHAAADARDHVAALKAELEAKRPGWTIDMDTGKWSKSDTPVKK